MPIKFFIILITIVILGAVIDAIRREKMTFKYAVNWFIGGVIALFCALNEKLLFAISEFAGFSLPSNFIFFLLLIFVIFLSLHLTLFINEQNSRAESLAQAIAKLEHELKDLKSKNNSDSN